MEYKNEKGAIVVEASIALPVYVFVIFTILSIVNICYAQTKVQIALNTAAKQLSEISYVMYASSLVDAGDVGGGTTSQFTGDISKEIDDLMSKWGVQNDTISEISSMIGQTSLKQVIDSSIASIAMQKLVEREFKVSKDGSASELAKKLRMDGVPVVHAIKSTNDVLVAGAYYNIKVIELLNIDFTFQFHSGTISYLWTNQDRSGPDIGKES